LPTTTKGEELSARANSRQLVYGSPILRGFAPLTSHYEDHDDPVSPAEALFVASGGSKDVSEDTAEGY